MAKARYLGCVRQGWEHTELEYEYRGKTYFVTKHNNGYLDKTLKQQHEEAQRDIDSRIEEAAKGHEEWKYEGSAFEAFDMFWDMVEGQPSGAGNAGPERVRSQPRRIIRRR